MKNITSGPSIITQWLNLLMLFTKKISFILLGVLKIKWQTLAIQF